MRNLRRKKVSKKELRRRWLEEAKRMPYHAYLMTEHWQETREKVFKLKGRYCERCKREEDLHVHHETYKRKGEENIATDLIVLCEICHDLEHRRYTPPKFEGKVKLIKRVQ